MGLWRHVRRWATDYMLVVAICLGVIGDNSHGMAFIAIIAVFHAVVREHFRLEWRDIARQAIAAMDRRDDDEA